jgi:Fe2+ transport system protein FeoA
MVRLDDTCLLYRGGKEALEAAKEGATAVIDAGGAGSLHGQKCLYALDKRLLELGVSPGGSADLLAGTLFLDAIERQQTEIPVSPMIPSFPTDQQKLVQRSEFDHSGAPIATGPKLRGRLRRSLIFIEKNDKNATSSVRSDI